MRSEESSSWYNVDNFAFRKFVVYGSMRWKKFDFTNPKWAMCCAEFGGPIGVFDRSSLDGRQCTVHVFTASGVHTGSAQWSAGAVSHVCFTRHEELLLVASDGKCIGYDMFGYKSDNLQFAMGLEAQEMKVRSARHFVNLAGGTGLAVLTNMNRVFVVNNVYDPKLWRNRGEIPGKSEPPSCWTVMAENRSVKIYLVLKSDVYVLSQAEMETIKPAVGSAVQSFVAISVSPKHEHCALLSDDARLFIMTADMRSCLCEMSLGSIDTDMQLLWCGESACSVYRPAYATLDLCTIEAGRVPIAVDAFEPGRGDAEPSCVHAVQEVDGVRLVSYAHHAFVHPVPDAVRAVYQIGSTAPGALLLRAYHQHSNNDYRSYNTLKLIEDECETAVRQCFEAAARQWHVQSHTDLLAAASLGKSFVPSMDPSGYVNMLRVLRVLNNVRHVNFGVAITYTQLQELSIPVLVDRIINRKQWPLAQQICTHLKLPSCDGSDRVLAHWAQTKMLDASTRPQRALPAIDMTSLAQVITAKMEQNRGIQYAEIAAKASELGLNELATLLLNNETNVQRQVNMLLRLNRPQTALDKAVLSGDPNLINTVIFRLKSKMSKAELDLFLCQYPMALAIFKEQCRKSENRSEHLKALYKQEDDNVSLAQSSILEAENLKDDPFNYAEHRSTISQAEALLTTARLDSLAHILNEQTKLLKRQEELERMLPGRKFVNVTLRQTVMGVFEIPGREREAEALCKDMHVSERQHCWWKTEALIKAGRFRELESFCAGKRPLIGYLPLIELCAEYGSPAEGQKYIGKLPPQEQVAAFILTGDVQGAAKRAMLPDVQGQSDMLLNQVASQCIGEHNRHVLDLINEHRVNRAAHSDGKQARKKL